MPQGEYGYGIKGNTAIKPLKKTTVRKANKQSENRKNKINKNKLFKKQKQSDRKYMLTVIITILGLGCVTIAGDGKVYKMQQQVTNLENEISSTKEENEALRVKILKYSSLNNIEENASNTLGMHVAHGSDVVKIDFSNNYFENVEESTSYKKEESSFWSYFFKTK